MLAAFRKLGGVIENVRLGMGPRGRGLFAIDNTQPVLLTLPDNLLFPADDVEFADGRIRLKNTASAGPREREFFENYESSFSWGAGGREQCMAFVADIDALPPEVRALLLSDFGIAKRFEGEVEERARRQFLGSRQVGWKGAAAIMPLIELANNSDEGLEYQIGDDLKVEGMVADEVFASYGANDAFNLFFNYGYAGRTIGAFSISMKTNIGANQLVIGSDTERSTTRGNYRVPEIVREGSKIVFSHLMIGHASYPAAPRGIFRTLAREFFGENTDEIFDTIRHFNRSRFLQLQAALEPYDGPLIAELGRMARYQLEAISWSIGSADLYAQVPPEWQEMQALETMRPSARSGWTWDKMLETFRGLGGLAENVRLAYGPNGRGIFAVDRESQFRLRVPENLLIPASEIVFDGDRIGVAPESAIDAAERDFFDRYEEAFSWGGGGQADSGEFIAGLDALPGEVRDMLAGQFGMRDLLEGDATTRAQTRFLRSRFREWKSRLVLAPLAELANHRPNGTPFGGPDGLELTGKSGGEIFTSYLPADAFDCFRLFGFASPEPGALCLPMKTRIGEFELVIQRNAYAGGGAMVMPGIRREGDRIDLSHLPLGHPAAPRRSRGIFRSLMLSADIARDEADEAFDRILHFNRTRFIGLLEALAPHGGNLIVSLRKMARFQLEAMSWCIGAREN